MQIARTRAVLAVGVIAVGLTVAACGSSSSSTSTSASGSNVASTSGSGSASGGVTARRTALRNCLKQHGVTLPNRRPPGSGGPPAGGPPPGAGGGFFGGGGGAASRFNNPKFRAAIQACGGFRRGNFRGRGFRLSHTTINNFVACVRKNGYPQMPSPNFSGGTAGIFPTSIRGNKQFQAAARKCANELRPSGTSTAPRA